MAKRKKGSKVAAPVANGSPPKPRPDPPPRRPILLGISVALFVLWLVFLVFVAWWD